MYKKDGAYSLKSDKTTHQPSCHPFIGDGGSVMATSPSDQLYVIDELTQDLDNLSCQMIMVQKDFHDREQPMEAYLKALQTQNDILEKALTSTMKEKEMTEEVYKKNNDELKYQMTEKNHKIHMLEQYCDELEKCRQKSRSESEETRHTCMCTDTDLVRDLYRKLCANSVQTSRLETEINERHRLCRQLESDCQKYKNELVDCNREKCELQSQVKTFSLQLSQSKKYAQEMARKLLYSEEKLKDQTKQLNDANHQNKVLENRVCQLKKIEDDNKIETNLLRNEIMTLREKEVPLLGKLQSLQEQLCALQQELAYTRESHFELKRNSSQTDFLHHTNLKRLQDSNNDTKREYNKVIEEYNKLLEEYEKLNDIHSQDKKVIQSYREWKEEQLISDKATEDRLNKYEEHIKLLLEEKEDFLNQIRAMHHDHNKLMNDLERHKNSCFNTSLFSQSDNPCLQRLRQASRRVTEEASALKNDAGSLFFNRKT